MTHPGLPLLWSAVRPDPPSTVTPLALTGWLEADQAELTVLHCPEDDDEALKAAAYRFCALQSALEPTGTFAVIPA